MPLNLASICNAFPCSFKICSKRNPQDPFAPLHLMMVSSMLTMVVCISSSSCNPLSDVAWHLKTSKLLFWILITGRADCVDIDLFHSLGDSESWNGCLTPLASCVSHNRPSYRKCPDIEHILHITHHEPRSILSTRKMSGEWLGEVVSVCVGCGLGHFKCRRN